ncbi:hypothetical protein N7489_005972 [Penicillium chrysogenum]|uniref:Uncharacterized protein n=1 Tax=Penicillium chrysogenum TaxID=5076 RepID=A0ABQ8W274_PENCH|nr:uncharacterized protein N7489_005972 [Penicillium chrysogenum]XP_061070695.1 uncharacterized protein N7525_000092 [Penicillium rubens]KAJ5235881.1 hypothetical protein N7489_005972 [Penicillium chrysogenum]KAJ5254789.1 hypothetical protein N7505_009940 [Penicillium chrysogenum]KAJ5275819.1 hypothetical protein N7524_001972 [Penicillium chrysogenum]KAJ5842351.1 hypothetical protein N7525_000092 [Penicillium rubens]KAJ5847076.1 hypothetical protein N7534_010745 [Penicillium rubens]
MDLSKTYTCRCCSEIYVRPRTLRARIVHYTYPPTDVVGAMKLTPATPAKIASGELTGLAV